MKDAMITMLRRKVLWKSLLLLFTVYTVILYLPAIHLQVMRYGSVLSVEGEASDAHVVETLRTHHLIPPPCRSYSIPTGSFLDDPSEGQSKVVREIFADKQDGVFVECGATDGVFLSNTLYLERVLKWRGLLIEADRTQFERLQSRNRNAYISNTCLSTSSRTQVNLFNSVQQKDDQVWFAKGLGKLTRNSRREAGISKIPVHCFPFYSYMLALDIDTVDYFSLDVEGLELDILKTIPFDKVDIKVISVEWWHYQEYHPEQKQSDLNDFLTSKGYREYKSKNVTMRAFFDKIYVKDGFELNVGDTKNVDRTG